MGKHESGGEDVNKFKRLLDQLKPYRKSIVAIIGAALTAIYAVVTNGITPEEWLFVAIQVAAAAGVYQAKNEPVEEENVNVQ